MQQHRDPPRASTLEPRRRGRGPWTRWPPAIHFRPKRAPVSGRLAGVTLLTLALFVAGLLLNPPAASAAPAQVRVEGQAAALPISHRPRRTPTPTPTATVVPTPTATPTTMATVTPTAATPTMHAGTHGGQSGSASGGAQTADDSLGALLGWGLGALVVALLVFGLVLVLFTRRTARQSQRPAFASPVPGPTQARLTQLHQVLPTREAAPLLEEGTTWELLPPSQETPASSPLPPPRWMIEAGLLTENTGDQPAADPPVSSGQGDQSLVFLAPLVWDEKAERHPPGMEYGTLLGRLPLERSSGERAEGVGRMTLTLRQCLETVAQDGDHVWIDGCREQPVRQVRC